LFQKAGMNAKAIFASDEGYKSPDEKILKFIPEQAVNSAKKSISNFP